MGLDGVAASSQWGSAGAWLEGDRLIRIAPASGVKPEQRKWTGLGGYRAMYRVGCVMVSAREGERLTCGARETPGPTWQRPGRGKWHGWFVEMGWAGSTVEMGWLGGIRPMKIFPF
jgi:hypothetical protein